MDNKKTLVILADGFEEIEAITVIDILRRAQIEVTVAGLAAETIKGARSIKVVADTTVDQINQDFAACILPGGGPGADKLSKSGVVRKIVKSMNKQQKIIAAICAAPAVVLAPWGILDNKRATCYPSMEDKFGPRTEYSSQRVVIEDNIITSQGPGTALLFALAIAEKVVGKVSAEKVKKAVLLD